MLVGYAEGLAAAKTYADRDGYRVDPNRELLGLGAANFASGLASGMVVNGSLSKTAVNGSAGAKSQVSGLVCAVLVVITLLFLTGLFEELPEATLAAVVIAALIELVDVPALRRLYRIYSPRAGQAQGVSARADFIAAMAALLGVLIFDTLPGLFIGIAISILLLVYRASRPRIATLGRARDGSRFDDLSAHADSRAVPGLVILRPESSLFFANADAIRDAVEAAAAREGTRAVVLDAQSMPDVDVTGAEMLVRLASTLEQRGVQLLVAREIGQARDVLHRTEPTTDELRLRLYPTVRAAVEAFERAAPD
jgi:MFS superfamily sulfate permease-like transporter